MSHFTNHPLPAVGKGQKQRMLDLLASAPGQEFSRRHLMEISNATAVPTRISEIRADLEASSNWTVKCRTKQIKAGGPGQMILSFYKLVLKDEV